MRITEPYICVILNTQNIRKMNLKQSILLGLSVLSIVSAALLPVSVFGTPFLIIVSLASLYCADKAKNQD